MDEIMKNNKNIYVFFLVLALLFLNPLTYYLFYHNKNIPVNYYRMFEILCWLAFIAGVILVPVIKRGISGNKFNNILFAFSFFTILFSILVLVNSAVGYLTGSKQKESGLLFPPGTTAHYSTVEFTFEAKTNSIGLRDHELKLDKGNTYRILSIGDSWTFGWGVALENSWPKQMESYLIDEGYDNIEVVNCGQGGGYTVTYREYMAKVVPVLRPDLVLVAVHQGDDMYQLYENEYVFDESHNGNSFSGLSGKHIGKLVRLFMDASFGNMLSLVNWKKELDIHHNWKLAAKNKVNSLGRSERLNYNLLEDTVKVLFETGNLNPGLIHGYVADPAGYLNFTQIHNVATQFAIRETEQDFAEMKRIADHYGAELVIINLADSDFTGHEVTRTPYTPVINEFLYANNIIDSIYRSIANEYDLNYIQLTEYFKALEDKNGYFFKYDGHPNERGYYEIGTFIARQLIDLQVIKKE